MSVWKLYRYEDQVYAPTMVVTEDGAFVETQPVQMVSIDDIAQLIDLIRDVLQSKAASAQEEDLNNPDNPGASSAPIMLELLQIKRWKDFEKRALMYTLHQNGFQLNMYVTGRGGDGMWTVDQSRSRSFNVEESLNDACQAIAAEVVSRRPVESPRALGVAMLPAPRDPD